MTKTNVFVKIVQIMLLYQADENFFFVTDLVQRHDRDCLFMVHTVLWHNLAHIARCIKRSNCTSPIHTTTKIMISTATQISTWIHFRATGLLCKWPKMFLKQHIKAIAKFKINLLLSPMWQKDRISFWCCLRLAIFVSAKWGVVGAAIQGHLETETQIIRHITKIVLLNSRSRKPKSYLKDTVCEWQRGSQSRGEYRKRGKEALSANLQGQGMALCLPSRRPSKDQALLPSS